MLIKSLSMAAAAALLLGGCGFHPKAPAPVQGPPEPLPQRTSTVNVPVTIPLAEITSLLEQNIPTEIVRWDADDPQFDCYIGTCGLRYSYKRRPANVSMAGNEITVSIPGNFMAKIVRRKPTTRLAGCGDGDDPWESKPRINATIVSKVTPANWRLTTASALVNPPDGLDIGDCRLAIIDFNVDGRINDAVAPKVRDYLAALDARVPQLTDLRPSAEAAWTRLNEPMPVAENVWLRVRPEGVALAELRGEGDRIATGIQITANPEIIYGPKPSATEIPLPGLASVNPDKGFHVLMRVAASYAAINARLAGPDGVVGKTYPIDGSRSFRVKAAEVYGFGWQAVLRVDLEGWKNGEVYLVGSPKIDPETDTLYVDRFDYTVETKNVFFKLVDAAFHENFRRQLEAKLRYPMADSIQRARSQITEALNREIAPRVRLTGAVDDIQPLRVTATEDAFEGLVEMNGQVSIAVE
jgi:hypothetical protein